ncbi:MAG TPA: alpha-2-macroglobulin family protein [Planctomycetota bacterium]|jgi:hypothetical protein
MKLRYAMLLALVFVAGVSAGAEAGATTGTEAGASTGAEAGATADAEFLALHFEPAAQAYETALASPPATPLQTERCWYAYGRAIASYLRAEKPEQAERVALRGTELFTQPLWAARAERSIGNLYLQMNHSGTLRGGKPRRSEYDRTSLTAYDRQIAIAHLERAREHYATCAERPAELELAGGSVKFLTERTDCLFELAAALNAFSEEDEDWAGHWYSGGEASVESVSSEEEYIRPPEQAPLREIPADEKDKPVFLKAPSHYAATLPAGQKFKAVLREIEQLDNTPDRAIAARALFRHAMAARAYYMANRPKEDAHKLDDNEVWVSSGGRNRIVKLPSDEDTLALLRRIPEKYPDASETAVEALYSVGAVYQSRGQFREAIEAYLSVVNNHLHTPFADYAYDNIRSIKGGEVSLSLVGAALAGKPLTVNFQSRNEKHLSFKLHKLDYLRFLREQIALLDKPAVAHDKDDSTQNPSFDVGSLLNGSRGGDEYLGQEMLVGERDISGAGLRAGLGDYRITSGQIELPAQGSPGTLAGGMYLLIAHGKSDCTARLPVCVQDLAIVLKTLNNNRVLIYVVDPRDGNPVGNAKLEVHELVTSDKRRLLSTHTQQSNGDGLSEFALGLLAKDYGELLVIATAPDGRIAVHHGSRSNSGDYGERSGLAEQAFIVTDRPVYRPGQQMKAKLWFRLFQDNVPQPCRSGERKEVYLRDALFHSTQREVITDEFGAAEFTWDLNVEAPLGVYCIESERGRAFFRVEEYKRPEFEVTVKTAGQIKLGERFEADVSAKYYFGAPVAGAAVRYRIYRQEYTAPAPQYQSWWWHSDFDEDRDYGREIVQHGSTTLGVDGTLKLAIDTLAAKTAHPDNDSLYTIKVAVCDASRRTIEAEGKVKVMRQQCTIAVAPAKGFATSGETLPVTVAAADANGAPVSMSGDVSVTLAGISVLSRQAQTGSDGTLKFDLPCVQCGRYEIKFEARDAWNEKVSGSTVLTVFGPGFNVAGQVFPDLELVSEKREYTVGETARVLVAVGSAGAGVLFSDQAERDRLYGYRLLRLNEKFVILELPLQGKHAPNFFLEATTVAQGKVHAKLLELRVNPKDVGLNVSVTSDKPRYGPGEQGTITVKTTALDGKPVKAQVALSVYDKSILYVQPEFPNDIRSVFWQARAEFEPHCESSLTPEREGPSCSDPYDPSAYTPPEWSGHWGRGLAGSHDFARAIAWYEGCTLKLKAENYYFSTEHWDDVLGSSAGRGGGAAFACAFTAAPALTAPIPSRASMSAKGADPELLAQARVRRNFSELALWAPALVTGPDGTATATVTFPESLTTWQLRAHAMDSGVRAGSALSSAVTTKGLLVRLQAPRFFVEKDEVMLSANVHNYLQTEKQAVVQIEIPGELLELVSPREARVIVPADSEKRVDWTVKVKSAGRADVSVKALTDQESDAVSMQFPVLICGSQITTAQTATLRSGQNEETKMLEFAIPERTRPGLTSLQIHCSPGIAGAVVESLPYLAGYPYGCTEQTLSRFMPTIAVRQALKDMKVDLASLAPPQDERAERMAQRAPKYGSHDHTSPVFDKVEVDKMVAAGLERLLKFQHRDDGWGWWEHDESSTYMTAYVAIGLTRAQQAGADVSTNTIGGAYCFLTRQAEEAMHAKELREGQLEEHALAAYALSHADEKNLAHLEWLCKQRASLSVYGRALLALACQKCQKPGLAKDIVSEILQKLKYRKDDDAAWVPISAQNWWRWYNSEVETNAAVLSAVVATDPKPETAGQIARWLVSARSSGHFWRATRDTSAAIAALLDYLRKSAELEQSFVLRLDFDGGRLKKEIHFDKGKLFGEMAVPAELLRGGPHTVSLTKVGKGTLFVSGSLSYFSEEDEPPETGKAIRVERTYFKLEPVAGKTKSPLRYKKIALKSGDVLHTGDLLEVELRIASDNEYEFVCFEDMKPACCEPVSLRSGHTYSELCANVELRDDRIAFFAYYLPRGESVLTYRLWAQTPGTFTALPAQCFAMYSPQLRASSAGLKLKVE